MRNKKGFEMVWNIWVVMILAIILLIFVLAFFAKSSGNFMDNIKSYFSKSNVDSVVKGCNILIDSGNKYGFCCEKVSVTYFSGKEFKKEESSCFNLMNRSFVNNEIKSGIDCTGYECQ